MEESKTNFHDSRSTIMGIWYYYINFSNLYYLVLYSLLAQPITPPDRQTAAPFGLASCRLVSFTIGRTARSLRSLTRPALSPAVEHLLFTPFQAPLALRLSRVFEQTPPFGRLRSAWFLARKNAINCISRPQKRQLNSRR